MGIKGDLTSVPEDAEVKKLLKLLEEGKKSIGEKCVEFFKKEEGICMKRLERGISEETIGCLVEM